jgi:ATP-dependent Clp protease adaptor protein ClpS
MSEQSPAVARPDIQVWTTPDETAELDPPANVVVHNDDVTPYDFVIAVLQAIFRLSPPHAERVTWTAHTRGQAHVITLSHEEAKYRVGKAHGLARQAGYPLTFTVELE